jgi:biotin synthase
MADLRTGWTKEEISNILMELIYKAATVHREHHETGEVQVCTLLSIKTGGCPEDCDYCPQSAHNDFDQVLDMVSEITDMSMEVCCTLGILT